jgi:hypothetical protein
MSETELAVGESMTRTDGGLRIETTRSEEHLFTTTYTDPDTGTVTLALQVDITTGATAIDPNAFDPSVWTLRVGAEATPTTDLRAALRAVDDPSLEVDPEAREIHVSSGADA